MKKNKGSVIHEILKIKSEIDHFRSIYINRIRFKRFYIIGLSTFFIIILGYNKNLLDKIYIGEYKYIYFFFFLVPLFEIILSIKVLLGKFQKTDLSHIEGLSYQALLDEEIRIRDYRKFIIHKKGRGKEYYISSFIETITIIFSIVVTLTYSFLYNNENKIFLYAIYYFDVFFFTKLLGNIIGSPMTINKFYKIHNQLISNIINSYLNQLDSTKLNK